MEQAIQFDEEAKRIQAKQLLNQALAFAKTQGANAAEAFIGSNCGVEVTARMAQVETIEYENSQAFSIVVYFGNKKGSASSSDIDMESIQKTVASACEVAKYISEDEYNGLPDSALLVRDIPDLDLYHPWQVNTQQMMEIALQCENAARSVKKIVNSEGASVTTNHRISAYGNTNDFLVAKQGTHHSMHCIVVAGDDSGMQRDMWSNIRRDAKDFNTPDTIGKYAAQRAVSRLGAHKIKSCSVPVLFDPRTARSLISCFLNAINGGAIYRGTSFLLDALNQQIFPPQLNMIEQPLISKGLYSSAFDNEGVVTSERHIIKQGVLQNYVLDSYSARKLHLQSTGNAGGVRNLLVVGQQEVSQDELIEQMGRGLIATELIGSGINPITGDFSQGVAGFWVEDGVIAYPVEEMTLAGNLKEMFLAITGVGKDLDEEGNIRCGSILIDNMTVAGI